MLLKLLSSIKENVTTIQQLALRLGMDTDLVQSRIKHCTSIGYIKEQLIDTTNPVQNRCSLGKGLLSLSCNFCPFTNNCSSSENDDQILMLTSKGKRAIEFLTAKQ